MAKNDFFIFEDKNSCQDVKIYYSEIYDVADEREDYTPLELMDDDTFNFYCEIILQRRGGFL